MNENYNHPRLFAIAVLFQVGSWSLGNLSLDMKRLILPGGSGAFTSACPNVKECNACFPPEQSSSSSLTYVTVSLEREIVWSVRVSGAT